MSMSDEPLAAPEEPTVKDGIEEMHRDRSRPRRSSTAVPLLRAALAALALCAGACGSEKPDSDPPPGANGPRGDFPAQMAKAVCDNIGPCCMEEGLNHSPDSCRRNAERTLNEAINQRYATTAADGVVYDPTAAAACVNGYTARMKACYGTELIDNLGIRIREASEGTFEPRCDDVFAGKKPRGEHCETSRECVAGSSCLTSPDGPLVCTAKMAPPPPPHAQLGKACLRTCGHRSDPASLPCEPVLPTPMGTAPPDTPNDWCFVDDGLFCDPTWVCKPQVGLGEVCTPRGCRGEAFCDQGVCTAPRESGSCSEARAASCVSSSYCDEATLQCRPRKQTGEVCTGDDCIADNTCRRTCARTTVATYELCTGKI